jgi:reactive intermediate/imine deaminase
MKTVHRLPLGAPPVSNYSQAVEFTGRLVCVSGQVPLDEEGDVVGVDDITLQARQVFRNIATVLRSSGATLADVVELTIYLTDITDLAAFRAVRDEFLTGHDPPASTLVAVSALVRPEFRLEISALAAISDRQGC